ncbi:MAG: DUF2079 domain-containing protein [Deltaproteobacteria bacterium]|nr:DUF2079 domain-containing protein [Deltaproteobacteria bacterium]
MSFEAINLDSKFNRLKEILENNRTPLIYCVLYVAIFSVATILRYETFHAAIMDLGAEIHELFLISGGYLYFFNPNGSLSNASLLAGYFEILYIPLGFIYKIIPHVSFFLILQSFLIGVSAFPFYYISRDLLGNKWGFIGPLLILLNPQIHTGNMDDFHISVFYVPLISFALYFALKKRLFLFYLFSFLVLVTKADSFIYLTSMAVFMFLLGYKKKHIFIMLTVAWAYGFFILFYMLPHIQGNSTGRWAAGTGHPIYLMLTEGIKYLKAFNLTGFASTVVGPLFQNIKYNFRFLLYLLTALGFMPLFSKKMLAVTVLPLLVCWLVSFYPNHFYYYEPFLILQYSYFTVPFFVLAAVYGLKNASDFISKTRVEFLRERFNIIFAASIIVLTVLIQNYSSISNFGLFNIFNMHNYEYKNGMHPGSLRKAFETIKQGYSVSASNFLGSHLYKRYFIALFPDDINYVDYIAFSTCYFIPYNKKRDLKLLNTFDALKNSGRYNVVYKKGCNTILKLKGR